MIQKLDDATFYIGTDDHALDLFESQYTLPQGVSYNSYLYLDNKVAIMDTVDARMGKEWQENLLEALGGRQPDYLVVHHMEPDHSALVDWTLRNFPALKVVASARAIQMLSQFFDGIDTANRCIAVKEGDVLDLGQHRIHFFAAPMIHWPEVMVSYDVVSKTLYSADAFGKFGTLSQCGFYGRDDNDWACEARRYYFNIVGKYGNSVQTLLAKLSAVEIAAIRPLHGPILEDNLSEYLHLYDIWSRYESETDGIFIAVASIHGGTMAAVQHLADLLRAKGAPRVVVSDLCRSDMAENVEDAFRYSKMVLAASSYDAGVFSPMHDFLHRLQSKAYTKRTVGLVENGSWAPCAGRVMKEMLAQMKAIDIIEPMVSIRSRMKPADQPAFEALATALLAKQEQG